MDFTFSPQDEAFRQEVRDFLKDALPPDWFIHYNADSDDDEDFAFARAFSKRLAQKAWLTITWPKEYGGSGHSKLQQLIFAEETAYMGRPRDISMDHAVAWVGPSLMMYGTEEQKKEFIPTICKAGVGFCTLYSEPGAGSDLAGLQTRAVEDGDDFVVNGQKIWTSGGMHADWGWLACRTDSVAPKHKGISMLLLNMRSPGITIRPIYTMANEHHFNEVFFDNVRVPKKNLVGEKNMGWYIVTTGLNFERSGVGSSAGARRSLERLIAYAKATKRNGKRLIDEPTVRNKLANMRVEIEIARMLSYRVAWLQIKGKVPSFEASISKMYGSELGVRLSNVGMEILGLAGQLTKEEPRAPLYGRVENAYLHSLGGVIGAGTSEIMRNTIAQRGLGLPR